MSKYCFPKRGTDEQTLQRIPGICFQAWSKYSKYCCPPIKYLLYLLYLLNLQILEQILPLVLALSSISAERRPHLLCALAAVFITYTMTFPSPSPTPDYDIDNHHIPPSRARSPHVDHHVVAMRCNAAQRP